MWVRREIFRRRVTPAARPRFFERAFDLQFQLVHLLNEPSRNTRACLASLSGWVCRATGILYPMFCSQPTVTPAPGNVGRSFLSRSYIDRCAPGVPEKSKRNPDRSLNVFIEIGFVPADIFKIRLPSQTALETMFSWNFPFNRRRIRLMRVLVRVVPSGCWIFLFRKNTFYRTKSSMFSFVNNTRVSAALAL